jgi:hypothetical protein
MPSQRLSVSDDGEPPSCLRVCFLVLHKQAHAAISVDVARVLGKFADEYDRRGGMVEYEW